MPYLRYFKIFSRNKWRNIDRVQELRSNFPIMFISGLQDELVPPVMMQELIDVCASTEKTVVRFENGTHNTTWMCPGYYRAISKFIYPENIKTTTRPRSRSTRRDNFSEMDNGVFMARNQGNNDYEEEYSAYRPIASPTIISTKQAPMPKFSDHKFLD